MNVRPEYVKLIGTALIRWSANSYYRPAGMWEVNDEFVNGQHVVSKDVQRELIKAVGEQFIPITREEFIEDNRGYVDSRTRPWDIKDGKFTPDDRLEDEDDDDIAF